MSRKREPPIHSNSFEDQVGLHQALRSVLSSSECTKARTVKGDTITLKSINTTVYQTCAVGLAQIFEAMLWSDPRAIQGRQLSARGAGVEFGQDVTHEFLRTNRSALIIRSHECVREGFELLHSGRLITLFSAR